MHSKSCLRTPRLVKGSIDRDCTAKCTRQHAAHGRRASIVASPRELTRSALGLRSPDVSCRYVGVYSVTLVADGTLPPRFLRVGPTSIAQSLITQFSNKAAAFCPMAPTRQRNTNASRRVPRDTPPVRPSKMGSHVSWPVFHVDGQQPLADFDRRRDWFALTRAFGLLRRTTSRANAVRVGPPVNADQLKVCWRACACAGCGQHAPRCEHLVRSGALFGSARYRSGVQRRTVILATDGSERAPAIESHVPQCVWFPPGVGLRFRCSVDSAGRRTSCFRASSYVK